MLVFTMVDVLISSSMPAATGATTSTALSVVCDAAGSVLPESGFALETREFSFARSFSSQASPVNVSVWQDWDTFGLSCVVWPSSIQLASYLAVQPINWLGKRVVELGA